MEVEAELEALSNAEMGAARAAMGCALMDRSADRSDASEAIARVDGSEAITGKQRDGEKLLQRLEVAGSCNLICSEEER